MTAVWDGNLCNTGVDIFTDTVVLVITVCAYAPQFIRFGRKQTTRGISPYFILCSTIFSNTQLSQILLLAGYAWPTARDSVLRKIGNGTLEGLRAFGGILGVLQIAVQWMCSIIVLLTFAATHSQTEGGKTGSVLLAIAFAHAALVIVPIATSTLPRPAENHRFETDIIMAVTAMTNDVVAPSAIAAQFIAQLKECSDHKGKAGALSLPSLGVQIVAMVLLSIRWFLRLGRATWRDADVVEVWAVYQWGFPAFNYALYAFGCAILLAYYIFLGRRGARYKDIGERAPLLGSIS